MALTCCSANPCRPALPNAAQTAKIDRVLEFLQSPKALSDVDLAAKVGTLAVFAGQGEPWHCFPAKAGTLPVLSSQGGNPTGFVGQGGNPSSFFLSRWEGAQQCFLTSSIAQEGGC